MGRPDPPMFFTSTDLCACSSPTISGLADPPNEQKLFSILYELLDDRAKYGTKYPCSSPPVIENLFCILYELIRFELANGEVTKKSGTYLLVLIQS